MWKKLTDKFDQGEDSNVYNHEYENFFEHYIVCVYKIEGGNLVLLILNEKQK